MQVGQSEVVQNSKKNAIHMESIGISKTNVWRRINPKKKKEAKSLWASVITLVRWDIKL